MDLTGKVALIQGGGAGVGRACALALAARGCKVAFGGRTLEPIQQLAEEIRAGGGEALPVRADVTDPAGARHLFGQAREAFGPVDILVNNVGSLVMGPLSELEPEGWHLVLAQNLHAAYYCCREALADMLPRRSGVIVNIGSGGAIHPEGNAAAYCTAKHGLRGLTLSLAEEVRRKGVKVALVNPVGIIDKPAIRKRGRAGKPDSWMLPEDIARAVLFLAEQGPRGLTTEINVAPQAPEYG
ncbi:MAG: SDR family oxidoreductase [Candidatus Tectomicrobia bacterium]|uniref:SDR family oxidoreductase n=1 Tax=Tectimicrobiota bacterium TaxID=2528274 RepID=A0A932MN75_UNCTE|nr:SDR family oxidoreductase [Candidatus Tectomicrobia bacterium]